MLRIQATIGLNTYYFASEALDYDNRYWEPRISNAFQISRSFSVSDKSGNKIRTMDVQLDNRDGYFNSIEAADGLLNSKFTMYFNEGDNAVKKFTGKVTKINSYGEDISLNIREVGYEYLKEKFPDAQIAYDYYSTSGINDSWNAIPIHFGTVNRYPTPWVNLFYSDFIIGSGPIFKVSKIYFDKTVVFDIATGQNGYKPTPTSKTIKFRVYKGTGSTGSPEVVGGVESRYPGFAYIQLYDEATGDPIDPSTPDGEVSQIYVDLEGIVNAAGTAAERNPAQILYNLFTKPYTGYEGYGLGVSASDLDFSAAITECTIQGFKIDGSIDNTTEFGEWIDEILRCCRGQLREDAGVISIKIDSAPSAASVHFDETGEIGYDCNVATWNEPDRDSQTNRLKLSYSWNFETGKFNKKPDANEESPLGDTHLIDEAHALRLGGGIIPKYNTETLEYKLIKDDTTAHKLAQYYLKSITKQLKTTSLTTEVTIPNLDAGTVVKVTSPKFGWNQKQFRITNISRLEEYTELELQEYSADIFTFIDPGTGAETSGQLYSVYNIPAKPEMTSLVVTNEQLADGTTQTKVDVEFVAPTENAQFISLYYKLTSETEADFKPLAMELATTGTMSAIWKGIEVGNYNFRLVTISSVGIYSDLSVISGDKHYYGQPNAESYKTMTGDTVAPGKPTIPDYLLGQGVVTLSFDITGGVPSDFSHFAVSRKLDGGSLELIDAKYTGRLFTDTDVASYVARQYSIVAYDKTGNASETSDLTIALTPLKIATNDIQAGAITSETITSNAIYGKLFMTRCNVGCGVAGVIFDSAGIRAYSTTANTFNMDAATGNVSMTGTICALCGVIGGFTVSSTEGLYAGCTTTRVQMKPGAGFWAGATAIGDAPFSVTQAGVLKSTSGSIGGFSIGTNILCSTPAAGCSVGMSACNTSGAVAFWAGCSTVGSAPFRVTNLGALTAISGAIGGWTLAAASLSATNASIYSGAANVARVEMGTGACSAGINSANAGTDISFWAGSTFANRATAPFRITAAGVLTATNANITGAITATSGTFTGTVCACAGCIAGFSITNAAGIYSGSAATRIQMLAGTGLWLGADAFASAPFSVTNAGVLKAISGTIGGWTLSTNRITSLLERVSLGKYSSYGTGLMLLAGASDFLQTQIMRDCIFDGTSWLCHSGIVLRSGADGSVLFRATSCTTANSGMCAILAGWNFNASQLYSTGCGLILCNTGAIQTGDFVASNKGWKIDSVGNAEFNNICARGAIRTAVFIKDQISVVGGCVMIRPADVTEYYDRAISATCYSIYVKDSSNFAANDLIRFKDADLGIDTWARVVSTGACFIWVCTQSGSTSGCIYKGATIVNYGSCVCCGGIMLNGQCPYIDLYTHAGLPWTSLDSRVRIGNLAGWGSFDTLTPTYGIAAGCPTGQYMTYDSVSGALNIKGNLNVGSVLPLSMPYGAVGNWSAKGSTTAGIALAGGVKDISGNGFNGQSFGGTVVSLTSKGQSFYFDGSDDYIAIPDNSTLEGMATVSFSARIFFSSFRVGGYDTILSKGIDEIYQLRLFSTTNQIQFEVKSATGLKIGRFSQSALSLNTWYDVVGIYDGTEVSIYVNGVKGETTTALTGNVLTNAESVYIGKRKDGFNFNGYLIAPTLFNRALTAEEVKTLYLFGSQQESGVITADRVQTGVLSSLNWAASTGSCISMNDGTFMFGGSSAPKLRWDGTTLCVNGCITSTAGSIGGWNIAAAALSTCAGAGIFCLVSSCASIYSYSCTYNSYAMHGKLFWSGAWKDAFGFSVTDGASGTLAAGMGYTTSSSVSLPSGTTMAAGCPFFYVGSGSTSYMQYYGGTLSVKGDVEVLSNGNILPDPDFRGVKYAASYLPGQASGTIVGEYFLSGSGTYNLATVHRTGTCAVYAKSNSNAMMIYAANSSSHASVCSIDFIPVQCAATYTLSGYLAKEGANPSKASLGLLYYDINRALICYDYPAAQAVATLTTTPTRYVGVKVMPANAAYVKIVAYNFQPALGTWLYISGLQLEIGSVATAWKNNQGGTITANNVISGTLKSLNWNGSTTGSCINLGNGTFNFGGDKLTFDGTTLTVKGTVCATSGKIGCFDISNGYLDFNSSRSLIASHYLCFGYVGCCSKVLLRYDSFCFEYNHDQTYNHLVFCKEIGVCFHGELFGTERTMAEVIVNPKNTGATTEEAILKISIGHTANPYAICTNGQIQASTFVGAANFSNLISSNTSNPYDANNTVTNGFYYANANVSLYGQTDGAIYNQANSANWQGQIYQDYRTGQLAVRGKCNGGWTTWLCIATNGCQIVGCTTYNYAVCGVAFCCGGVAGCAGIVYGVIGKASCIGVWGCVGYDMGVFGLACRCYGLMGCGLVGYGVYGYGGVYGVFGCSGGNYGVVGKASNYGVCGIALGSYPVAGNGAYYNTSTRTLKQNFEDIYVLPGLRTVCIQKWTWADANQRGFDEFVAPVAEEVQRAWGLTFKDDGYYTLDGIALKAAQEIDENVQVHESCITYLKDENNVLKSCIEQMSCKLKLIEERLGLN